jgi:hypothetical protein
MARARGRRGIVAIGASAVLHVVVLAVLVLHAPRPLAPREESGSPPIPIIPVLLAPRAAPPGPSGEPGGAIRLHRRQVRPRELPPNVRPLVTPAAETPIPPAPAAPSPAPPRPQGAPPAPAPELSRVLRSGSLGCANLAALSRSEREACEERLGAGARDTPFIPPGMGMSREKKAAFDAAAAARSARKARQEGPVARPTGLPEPSNTYDGEPHITGAGESLFGQAVHPPSKRAARRLERLPP